MVASVYDEKAKCRVGEMDERQFFAECDASNVGFFKALLTAWQKGGGTLKWGAGGVGLRMASASKEKGAKEVGICFLAPKFAGKKDRIEFGCATLKKQIGEAKVAELQRGLRAAAGDRVKGASMISLVEPGLLSSNSQKAVIDCLIGIAKGG